MRRISTIHCIGLVDDNPPARARPRAPTGHTRGLFTRGQTVGRCPVCGYEVSAGEDFVVGHGRPVHSGCILYPPARSAGRPGAASGRR